MPRALDLARAAARQAGAVTYLSASPCRSGHAPGERYTSTGACKACVSAQSRPGRVRSPASPLAADDPLAAVLG